MFKTSFKAALLASAFAGLAATAALADEAVVTPAPMAPAEEPASPWTFNGSVGYTTNYIFRGLTQTQDDGAIFGSMGVAHESGLYAGVWGSSIDFNDTLTGPPGTVISLDDDANLEFDFYAGFANSINAFSYDVGAVYYMYPGANESNVGAGEYNYYELYAKSGYDFGLFALSTGVYYSPDFFGESGQSLYGYGGLDIPLPFLPFSTYLTGTFGYSEFFDDPAALDDYYDFAGGIGASVLGFDMTLKYSDTLGNSGPKTEINDAAVSFTVSRSF